MALGRQHKGQGNPRVAVLHEGLLLVRAADDGQIDRLVGLASIRRSLIYRLGDGAALFKSSALTALLERSQRQGLPFQFSELPAVDAADGVS